MKTHKKEFLETQEEAFPNLNVKRLSKYYDLKVRNKEIITLIKNKEYIGHLCFAKYLLNPPFAPGVFIEELAIKEQFRGRGYGTYLIKQLIKYCRKNKINIIYLSAGDFAGNKSFKFYKKLGFEKIGDLKEINPKSEYTCGQIFFGKVLK